MIDTRRGKRKRAEEFRMGRRSQSRPTSPYNDFAGKTFKQLALEPYPEYPDHYLSTTKRARAADMIRCPGTFPPATAPYSTLDPRSRRSRRRRH